MLKLAYKANLVMSDLLKVAATTLCMAFLTACQTMPSNSISTPTPGTPSNIQNSDPASATQVVNQQPVTDAAVPMPSQSSAQPSNAVTTATTKNSTLGNHIDKSNNTDKNGTYIDANSTNIQEDTQNPTSVNNHIDDYINNYNANDNLATTQTPENPLTNSPLTKSPSANTATNHPNPLVKDSERPAPTASAPTIIITPPPAPPAKSMQEVLLERARQNSNTGFEASSIPASDGSNIPAFRQLMDSGINDLKANRLSNAESKFTRAQRLAPKSSAVYFYLGQVTLKKNQPRKAEAMARRGLVVAEDTARRRALWQLILKSGQMQNNARVIQEANEALR